MNVGEYGLTHNINVNYDISGFSNLLLVYDLPNGTNFVAQSPDVTVGTSPLVTADGTFPANQYCRYIFRSGDLSVSGVYSVRLYYTDASKRLVSDAVTFTVNP